GRLALVHGPGTGKWRRPCYRAHHGYLRPGGGFVRDVDRPPAIPRGDSYGHADEGGRFRADAAARLRPFRGSGSGDDLLEVPAQGAGETLRLGGGTGRRPGPLPRW